MSVASAVQYKAGAGTPQEGEEGSLPHAPASQKPPWDPLNGSLRELLYRGGSCSLKRESDLPELPRKGLSWDLNPELSDSKGGSFLCHVLMGCPLGRTQHDGGQRGDPKDTALVFLTLRICVIIRERGPPFSVC